MNKDKKKSLRKIEGTKKTLYEITSEGNLVIQTEDLKELHKAHAKIIKESELTEKGYTIRADDKVLLTVWYSDYYDERCQSRHYVSESEYSNIWPKEEV